MRLLNLLIFIGIGGLFGACGSYSDDEISQFDIRIEKYLKSKNIDCKKSASGLYFKIVEEGEGDFVQYKDKVSVIYKGTFLDGAVFDEQKKPVELPVSAQINAWKELMLQLKKGSKAYMVVPPHLGYGPYEVSKIPSNSILVFELEVVDVL